MSSIHESLREAPLQQMAAEQTSLQLLNALDADLSAPWAQLQWGRRTEEANLLGIQQVRLLRRIADSLEKLCESSQCGKGCGNG